MTTTKAWLALCLLGCGTNITVTQINAAPHYMSPHDGVEVFSSGAPARPHVDVAILEGEPASTLSSDGNAEVIDKLRDKAVQLGCDALVIGGGEVGGSGHHLMHGYFATCIAYTDSAAEPPIATGPTTRLPAVRAPLVTEPIGFDPANDPDEDRD